MLSSTILCRRSRDTSLELDSMELARGLLAAESGMLIWLGGDLRRTECFWVFLCSFLAFSRSSHSATWRNSRSNL